MMNLSQALLFSILIISAFSLAAQPPITGHWIFVDYADGKEKSIVEFYETPSGTLEARVTKFLPDATVKVCEGCPGDEKGRSLIDLVFIWDLVPHGDYYHGEIFDPRNGKSYSVNVYPNGDELKVRAYIGIPLFGQSMYWKRATGYEDQ